jgi:hypothetical protein
MIAYVTAAAPDAVRETRDSPLKSRDPVFKNGLRAVRQPSVDIAGITQVEAVRGVPAAVKNIGGSLVNRYGAGIRRGIRLLLTCVKRECLKFQVSVLLCCRHNRVAPFFSCMYVNCDERGASRAAHKRRSPGISLLVLKQSAVE